ncbi:MAG: hypothetical protein JNM22_20580 [Saprospiraceae bacterium]|nr:hypothetical protein [Saprospiraceae bacterium]
MKNNLFLISLAFIVIECTNWNTKHLCKSSHSNIIWHYALQDSFIIQYEIDSVFHLTKLKSIWDDSAASYGYEYENSSIIISYYPLSTEVKMPMFDKVIASQISKIRDAYPERKINKSEHIVIGSLNGAYSLSNDNVAEHVTYQGVDQKNQIVVHLLITVTDNIRDSEALLREILSSMKFSKKTAKMKYR